MNCHPGARSGIRADHGKKPLRRQRPPHQEVKGCGGESALPDLRRGRLSNPGSGTVAFSPRSCFLCLHFKCSRLRSLLTSSDVFERHKDDRISLEGVCVAETLRSEARRGRLNGRPPQVTAPDQHPTGVDGKVVCRGFISGTLFNCNSPARRPNFKGTPAASLLRSRAEAYWYPPTAGQRSVLVRSPVSSHAGFSRLSIRGLQDRMCPRSFETATPSGPTSSWPAS
jgi:hypothetical protein